MRTFIFLFMVCVISKSAVAAICEETLWRVQQRLSQFQYSDPIRFQLRRGPTKRFDGVFLEQEGDKVSLYANHQILTASLDLFVPYSIQKIKRFPISDETSSLDVAEDFLLEALTTQKTIAFISKYANHFTLSKGQVQHVLRDKDHNRIAIIEIDDGPYTVKIENILLDSILIMNEKSEKMNLLELKRELQLAVDRNWLMLLQIGDQVVIVGPLTLFKDHLLLKSASGETQTVPFEMLSRNNFRIFSFRDSN